MQIIGKTICPNCRGDGERGDGSDCDECGGTGMVPVYDSSAAPTEPKPGYRND